jgi:hypothetical protein
MTRYLLNYEGPTDFRVWKAYALGVSVTSLEPLRKGEKLQPKESIISKFFGFLGPLPSRPLIWGNYSSKFSKECLWMY